TSLRTRSHEGSRPRMAIVPSSSTSCPVPVGYWTWNFTRRDSSSIIQVLHGTHGERETPLERPQGGFLTAEPGSTPGEAELEEEPPEDAEPRLGAPCRAARQAAFESMMTSQPEARGARLRELEGILGRTAPAEDRELLLAFAPVVFAETPDRVALGLSADALAARIRDHFRFVAREIPPPTQLYKGVPGIHVAARNPAPAGGVPGGPADGLPQQVTVVETHTHDAPFIFESLKNYFRKAGIRVFSAVHPIFTVRRQWERIVWIGGPREEGSKEVYCH